MFIKINRFQTTVIYYYYKKRRVYRYLLGSRVEFYLNTNFLFIDRCGIFLYLVKLFTGYFSRLNHIYAHILNCIFLCLIFCYKGVRLFFNLPCNGQRTWSNGKSCIYFCSIIFLYKYNFCRKSLKCSFTTFLSVMYLEYINLL